MKKNRSQMLSLRLTPQLRAALGLLSGLRRQNLSRTLESVIRETLNREQVKRPWLFNGYTEYMSLAELLGLLWIDDEIIFTLRLFYFFPEGLGKDEAVAAKTVVDQPGRYRGTSSILWGGLEEVVKKDADMPGFDLDAIRRDWRDLMRYAEFLRRNEGLTVSFETFLTFDSA